MIIDTSVHVFIEIGLTGWPLPFTEELMGLSKPCWSVIRA